MTIVDVGSGAPLVLIPGIQSRWEWMKPAVDALAATCRVITFSLADEPSSGWRLAAPATMDDYVEQVREAMDARGVATAVICGVSYGGLIAAAFSARYPARTAGLVLVSAVPPGWTPDRRVSFYLRAPRLLAPLFCVGSLRMYPEIAAATPGVVNGLSAAARHGWNVVTHIFSPARMAHRVRLLAPLDLSALACVRTAVLVVTGDEALDRIVPVLKTREYLQLWPHARLAVLERTGHLGLITRPDAFAAVVAPFVAGAYPEARRVG